jgi:hypothetical protein
MSIFRITIHDSSSKVLVSSETYQIVASLLGYLDTTGQQGMRGLGA